MPRGPGSAGITYRGGVVVDGLQYLLVPPSVLHGTELGAGPHPDPHQIAGIRWGSRTTGDRTAQAALAELGAGGEAARPESPPPRGPDCPTVRSVAPPPPGPLAGLPPQVDDPIAQPH